MAKFLFNIVGLLALGNVAFALADEASTSKPTRVVSTVVKTGAIVESVNPETRELKLIDAQGRRFSVVVDDRVRRLDEIQPRDRIVMEYIQSVAVVVAPAGAKSPPAEASSWTVAPDSEMPGVEGVDTRMVEAQVVAINETDRLMTLANKEGETHTVKVRPETPLEKIDVGDQVRLRVTRAVAVSVERPAE